MAGSCQASITVAIPSYNVGDCVLNNQTGDIVEIVLKAAGFYCYVTWSGTAWSPAASCRAISVTDPGLQNTVKITCPVP